MKNKIIILSFITLCTLSLTACNYAFPFMHGGPSDEYSYRPIDSDYSGGGSNIPVGDIKAEKPDFTYSEFTDNNIYPISCTPSLGAAKLLVIPVWFTDSSTYITSAYKETVREDIQISYFGTSEATGWQSVKSYYETESHGVLSITGTVSEWYDCGVSIANYTYDPGSVPKTTALVEQATAWYFDNHEDNRTTYDCDDDGYLDGVMLIYGIPDYKALNRDNYDNLWAYCFWAQDTSVKNKYSPGVNAFFWASYCYMYGSDVVASRTGRSSYYSGDTANCNLDCHTYIHEMGHLFGLSDYYDYSENAYNPAGSFSMQDRNIAGHDPFSAYALGWAKAYVPTSTVTINLKPFTVSGETIILSPSFNTIGSPFDEYLMLEYYTRDGLNEFDATHQYFGSMSNTFTTGSQTDGIRLWHVDARLLYSTNGTFNVSQKTVNPSTNSGKVTLMMSNTYDDTNHSASSYLSPLGTNYADYNLLQLIRKSTTATYKPEDSLTSGSLFTVGSFFSMSAFENQFVNKGKLNSNASLGFTFVVNSFTSTHASITITKQ